MKELLMRVTCDYCREKLTVAAEAPSAELMNWIIVVTPSEDGTQPEQKFFCKRTCAINFLRGAGPIILPAGSSN